MKNLQDYREEIDKCLTEWARIYGHDDAGIGYPRISLEARMREGGFSSGPHVLPENEEADEAECWLRLLRANDMVQSAHALEAKYKFKNVTLSAKFMHISRDKFYTLINDGENFIIGILVTLRHLKKKSLTVATIAA
jgi:hypothetical protein